MRTSDELARAAVSKISMLGHSHWEDEEKIIADTYADTMAELEELRGAALQAFGALVGSHASDDSVQGLARQRLRKVLGLENRTHNERNGA